MKNFSDFKLLLNHVKFDLIVITEPHLTENVDSKKVYIEGYNINTSNG